MSLLRRSKYYRRRADELRLAATESRSSDKREILLCFAADFEELAAEVDCAEQTQSGERTAG